VKQRDKVAMTEAETADMLASQRKVQLATNGPDGFPHLVTMYYVMIDGQITFWTYRTSQKALNLERDPRISCLVETGEQYFDLRGVLVQGTAHRIDDPDAVVAIGRRIASVFADPKLVSAPAGDGEPDPLAEYVEHAARKRFAYAVESSRLITWDHTKLISPA
jgi:nitroimidazol reductase NimA-like FMN-containing flavoprotein (pyridoxamine 5'-phosphate oxidase superfamily)